AFEANIDYEALMIGLVVVVRRQTKDLHVFIDSMLIVDQVEGHKEANKGKAKRTSRTMEGPRGQLAPGPREYSYALRLNFQAFEADIDYEALMTGLVVVVGRQMKDLYVFIDSMLIVDQVEGYKEASKGKAKRYPEEFMNSQSFEPEGIGIDEIGNRLVKMPKPRSIIWNKDQAVNRNTLHR
nr:hypothetical protein [Tanacetum cinerariifolium]